MFLVGLLDTSPRPTSAAHALSRLCRLSVREICCTFLSFSAKHPQRACAHTPSPVYSSCIRSLIATRCNNSLFRRPFRQPSALKKPFVTLSSLGLHERQRHRATKINTTSPHSRAKKRRKTLRHRRLHCKSRLDIPPIHGARCFLLLNRQLSPTTTIGFCTTRQSLLHLAYLTRTAAHFRKTPFPWIAQASVEELSPC